MKIFLLISFASILSLLLAQFLPSYLEHNELSKYGKTTNIHLESYGKRSRGFDAYASISFLTESGEIVRQSVETRYPMEYFAGLKIIYSTKEPELWQPLQEFEDHSFTVTLMFVLGEMALGTPVLAYFMFVFVTLIRTLNDKQEMGFAQRFLVHLRKAG